MTSTVNENALLTPPRSKSHPRVPAALDARVNLRSHSESSQPGSLPGPIGGISLIYPCRNPPGLRSRPAGSSPLLILHTRFSPNTNSVAISCISRISPSKYMPRSTLRGTICGGETLVTVSWNVRSASNPSEVLVTRTVNV